MEWKKNKTKEKREADIGLHTHIAAGGGGMDHYRGERKEMDVTRK